MFAKDGTQAGSGDTADLQRFNQFQSPSSLGSNTYEDIISPNSSQKQHHLHNKLRVPYHAVYHIGLMIRSSLLVSPSNRVTTFVCIRIITIRESSVCYVH